MLNQANGPSSPRLRAGGVCVCSHLPEALTCVIFTAGAPEQGSTNSAARNPMKLFLGLTSCNALAKGGMYGTENPNSMIFTVLATRTLAAQLWKPGVLSVRRRWSMSV